MPVQSSSRRKPGDQKGAGSAIPDTSRASPKNGSAETAGNPSATATASSSIYRQYHETIAAIFAGKVSDPKDLYNPCSPFNPRRDVALCKVEDPRLREFFSLQFKLKEAAVQIPIPRHISQVKLAREQAIDLIELAKHAADFGWQGVRALLPKEEQRHTLALKDGWVVTRERTQKDRMMDDMRRDGFTPEQIDERMKEMFGEENCEGSLTQEIDELVANLSPDIAATLGRHRV